ncbi:uncharacterized protein ACNS7B_004495 [Menidia menidia]
MEKTLAVHRELNCCTEVLLESLEQLQELDSSRTGLLYGVPVSIKENVGYKDHDCSCGVLVNLECPVEEDSVLVQVLKLQGAVPFVKTNLPQALLNYDCSNPIFGQTVNPHSPQKTSGGSSGLSLCCRCVAIYDCSNPIFGQTVNPHSPQKTSGGSSGGEAALLGGGGSPLGIGCHVCLDSLCCCCVVVCVWTRVHLDSCCFVRLDLCCFVLLDSCCFVCLDSCCCRVRLDSLCYFVRLDSLRASGLVVLFCPSGLVVLLCASQLVLSLCCVVRLDSFCCRVRLDSLCCR